MNRHIKQSSVFSGMLEDKGRDHEDQPGGCSKQREEMPKPRGLIVEVCDLGTNNTPVAADRRCERPSIFIYFFINLYCISKQKWNLQFRSNQVKLYKFNKKNS